MLPRIDTERLLLRAFVAADAPAVERLADDRRVAEATLTFLIRTRQAAVSVGSRHTRRVLRNPPSGRVMQKIGMRFEGINRDAYRRFGRFENVAVYAILAPEWEAARPTP